MGHGGRVCLLLILCLFWRKLPLFCGCVRRSRLWWGQRRRSSPGRWQGRQGWLCRTPWQRQSSPSDRDELPLPWCCPQIPGHRRNLLPLRRCSAASNKGEMLIILHVVLYCTFKTYLKHHFKIIYYPDWPGRLNSSTKLSSVFHDWNYYELLLL